MFKNYAPPLTSTPRLTRSSAVGFASAATSVLLSSSAPSNTVICLSMSLAIDAFNSRLGKGQRLGFYNLSISGFTGYFYLFFLLSLMSSSISGEFLKIPHGWIFKVNEKRTARYLFLLRCWISIFFHSWCFSTVAGKKIVICFGY